MGNSPTVLPQKKGPRRPKIDFYALYCDVAGLDGVLMTGLGVG